MNALKEDILKKNIRQRESSPVQIVRPGDRQHPLTSNFSVYDEEDQSPGRVLDKRRNTAQTFGFEIAPGMGKKSQKNSVRFAQTADNFYNRSGVGFTTPDERSAMKQSKIESKFLSTAANTNFNRTTQNSSMGKGNVAVTQNFTLNTKNSTSQKKHKIVTKGGLRFYETDSNTSGSPSPQRGTPQGQVQSIEYSPSRSENSHSSQRSTSQILRSQRAPLTESFVQGELLKAEKTDFYVFGTQLGNLISECTVLRAVKKKFVKSLNTSVFNFFQILTGSAGLPSPSMGTWTKKDLLFTMERLCVNFSIFNPAERGKHHP